MCGIFGAISFDGPFPSGCYESFIALTDAVKYRGPDDSGYLPIDSRRSLIGDPSSFDVFLGNRRLAILDLSPAGHMPMTDEKGRWITYNGEIFNYVELREELEKRGHRFSTHTDTEVILHVYDEFGEAGFEKLNGMWALAIADLSTQRVILSRDRFSIKPLYICRSGNKALYFASEIKQLLPLLSLREVNANILRAYLLQGLLDHSPETFFQGITRAAPMCNVVVDLRSGEAREIPYAQFQPETTHSLEEARGRFRELLFDSTRIRLRSDVKVGLLLSGGLDSSAVAVANSQLAANPLETFSVVFDDPRISEEPYVDAVTQALRIRSHKLNFKPAEALGQLDAVLTHNDEPFGGLSVVAQHCLLKMIKQTTDVVVLLSGQGGDETLMGYIKFYFFYLKGLVAGRNYLRFARESLLSILHGTTLRNFRLDYARRYLPSFRQAPDWINGDSYQPAAIWDAADLRARQLADVERYSIPALTHYEDRNAMAFSLEVRHPFLDYRLLNFALGLPAEWKMRNGWTKSLLRESLPELPKKVRWCSRKSGFNTPEADWLKKDMTPLVRRLFSHSVLEEMGFLKSRAFLDAFAAYCEGRSGSGHFDLERTVLAEMWARKLFSGKPREEQEEFAYARAN